MFDPFEGIPNDIGPLLPESLLIDRLDAADLAWLRKIKKGRVLHPVEQERLEFLEKWEAKRAR